MVGILLLIRCYYQIALSKYSEEKVEEIRWNVSGKVVYLKRTENSDKPDIQFEYDAMGNRIAKHVIHSEHTLSTFYVHDAEGTIMATYTKTNETELALEEQPIYGSSRLGVYRPTAETGIMRGARTYEATNHLGNVLATYTDRIIVNDDFEYSVDQTSATDYYVFGAPMYGRSFSTNSYKFGFNGMESEDDLYGEKNAYDFGARVYDARLGRFLSVDPLFVKYPSLAPYCFVGNMPIIAIDPDGKKIFISIGIYDEQNNLVGYQPQYEYKNGHLYTMDGKLYEGDDKFARQVQKNLNQLSKDDHVLNKRINTLVKSKQIHNIVNAESHPDPNQRENQNFHNKKDVESGTSTGSVTTYDAFSNTSVTGDIRDPRVALAHELLGHGYDADQGTMRQGETENGIPLCEVDAINIENRARIRSSGDNYRGSYGGKFLGIHLRIVKPKETINDDK